MTDALWWDKYPKRHPSLHFTIPPVVLCNKNARYRSSTALVALKTPLSSSGFERLEDYNGWRLLGGKVMSGT